MPHLGADVAAYVDGQLSGPASAAADEHLASCDECAAAVRQQRLLKSRMSTGAVPGPPSDLIASLAQLSPADAHPTWTDRIRGLVAVPIGLAVLGAAFTVVAMAYAVGAADPGDEMRPPFDDYTAEFFGATAVPAATTFSEAGVARLNAQGWPCAEHLGGLARTTTAYDRTSGVLTVTYTDGVERLRLFEQPGRLDGGQMADFTRRSVDGRAVWVRDDDPMVVAWDRDGVVYTVVTNAGAERAAQVVAELPAPVDRSAVQRVGDGLARMSWN